MVKREGKEYTNWDYYYESWEDYVNAAERKKETNPIIWTESAFKYCRASEDTGSPKWNGCTMGQALKFARDGWEQGENYIQQYSADLEHLITDLIDQPVIAYDYDGVDWDMDRVLKGDPENWMRNETRVVQGQGDNNIVRIGYNLATPSYVKPDAMLKKGAVFVALVNLLELAGKRVEISLVHSMNNTVTYGRENYKDSYNSVILLKRPEGVLSVNQLAFIAAHSASLRRITFAVLEGIPNLHQKVLGSGYGGPREYPRAKDEFDVFIDSGLSIDWSDQDEVIKWIKAQLKEQGVKLVEDDLLDAPPDNYDDEPEDDDDDDDDDYDEHN